jgi:hypothetical protein
MFSSLFLSDVHADAPKPALKKVWLLADVLGAQRTPAPTVMNMRPPPFAVAG